MSCLNYSGLDIQGRCKGRLVTCRRLIRRAGARPGMRPRRTMFRLTGMIRTKRGLKRTLRNLHGKGRRGQKQSVTDRPGDRFRNQAGSRLVGTCQRMLLEALSLNYGSLQCDSGTASWISAQRCSPHGHEVWCLLAQDKFPCAVS